MPETTHWYILRTKKTNETKLSRFLARKGFETFCPLCTGSESWNLVENSLKKNLFTSWVFVHCTQEQLTELEAFHLSIKIVYRLDQPAVVSSEDIAIVKHAVQNFMQLQLIKTGLQTPQSLVLVQEDATCYALPSLGYTLVAREKIEQVYHPVWITEETITDTLDVQLNRNTMYLLKRLPSVVSSKIIKLSTGLFKAT